MNRPSANLSDVSGESTILSGDVVDRVLRLREVRAHFKQLLPTSWLSINNTFPSTVTTCRNSAAGNGLINR